MTDLLDRATGMLAGVAIGDALGMPTEFLTPELIQEWYGHVDRFVAAHPSHPHCRLPAGSVTDDTDQTLLLADLLLDQGRIKPERWAERLLAWSQTERVKKNRFVGPSTLKSLAAMQEGQALEQVPRGGTTVGAAMRVAALAIAITDRDHLVEQVVASCSITHFTRNAISGAVAMAFALAESLDESADLASVARAAQEGAITGRNHGDWSWALPIERRIEYVTRWAGVYSEEEALDRMSILIGLDLYPEQLVPNAVGLALLAGGDPQRAMIWAANMGGDTDTLASMTGSLCGGLGGVAAFDPCLLEKVGEVNSLDLEATAKALLTMRDQNLANTAHSTNGKGPFREERES